MSELEVHAILSVLDQLDFPVEVNEYSLEESAALRMDMLFVMRFLELADIEA